MRLTLELLGWTWDWTLQPTVADDEDTGQALNGGTLSSQVIGFTANAQPPWEDLGSPRQFEPEDRRR